MRLQDRLENYYCEKTDPQVAISDFTPISDGWETEVYSFTLTLRHPTPRILRLYPGVNGASKAEREYQGMLTLRRVSGYPVPAVMRQESDPAWLGKPFVIMQKIEGQPLGTVMIEDTARQAVLLTRFVQLAVDLHRIDYRPYVAPSDECDASGWLPAMLARWRTVSVTERGQTWALLVFDWLDAHMTDVTAVQMAVTHGDFHPYNILLTPDNQAYVIDWSSIAVGDYRRDLAWTLMLLATQGYEHLRPIILSQYAQLSGHPVEHIEYFEVMAALRRLFDFAVSVGSGAETLGMRPETAAVMRQQRGHYQQVYDLLRQRTGLRLREIERLIEG